jgi:hypothetical protein
MSLTTLEIPVDPKLPARFDDMPNELRPKSHLRWWGRPYIQTERRDLSEPMWATWLESWPTGVRYDVRCLDGSAWDRSTCWGSFATLEEAIACARSGPAWRRTNQ